MDPSRASSVYSTESSRKATYLQYQSSIGTDSRPSSSAAETDYTDSLGPAPSRTPPAIGGFSSKPTSRPSFMNYQDGAPARQQQSRPVEIAHARNDSTATTVPADSRLEASIGGGGLLLVFIVAEVHEHTMQYLERLLKRRGYSGLHIIGSQGHETEIKQLKMDMYGLVGRLGREMSVQTQLQVGWSEGEVLGAVKQATRSGDDVTGVLCCLSYGAAGTDATDILSLDQSHLAHSWQHSIGYLHTVAKATVPSMSDDGRTTKAGLFLVSDTIAYSPMALINREACHALLSQLANGHTSQSLTIDYAENVLVAEAEPTPTAGANGLRKNGDDADEYHFTPSESPTKLWNMWALQNE